jgi:hypothetical protein
MLAEIILKRDPRSVTDISAPTLIAPTAVVAAVILRHARRSLNFAIAGTDLVFAESIVNDHGRVTLVNDEAPTPGARWFYGQGTSGIKGWYPLLFSSSSGGGGGGDSGGDSLLNFIKSITESDGDVSLVNDEETPGASKYYGTDDLGAKGFHDFPEGVRASAITFGVSKSSGLVAGVLLFTSPVIPYDATIVAVSARIPQPTVDGFPFTFKFRKRPYGSTGTSDPSPGESINTDGLTLIADGTTLFTDLDLLDFTTLVIDNGDIIAVEITDTNGVPTAFQCALIVRKAA